MIDWVYKNQGTLDQVGFRELIVAFASAPHESLFSTELAQVLMESFWKRYFKVIIKLCFLPFIVYFVLTIWYLTYYGVQGIPKDLKYAFTLEFVVRCIILVLIFYFFVFEIL